MELTAKQNTRALRWPNLRKMVSDDMRIGTDKRHWHMTAKPIIDLEPPNSSTNKKAKLPDPPFTIPIMKIE